jgi:hypothetical protein
MIPGLLVALNLIFVHGPDQQRIEVNTDEISSIREPREAEGHFASEIKCLLFMTNGKFIGVTETCDDVLATIKEKQPKDPMDR